MKKDNIGIMSYISVIGTIIIKGGLGNICRKLIIVVKH